MQKRRLGSGGPEVSAVGIGAMSFAGVYGAATEAEAHGVLEAALGLGIDHIDTANAYGRGRSEAMIGSFLRGREGLFRIATKAAIRNEDGRRWFDNSAGHLEAELDASLKRLGIGCVDLFYVHRRDPALPIEAVAEALAGLVAKGKTRAVGFSEIAPSSLGRAAAVHPVAAVQSEYSLQTRLAELGLVQATAALGTALVAFSPVGRGLLTDAPPTAEKVAAIEFLAGNPRFQAPNLAANLALTDGFRRLAAEMGTPAASLAIAWVLARGPHVIAIPGTRSVAHLGGARGRGVADARGRRPRADRGGAAGRLGAWRSLFDGTVGRAGALRLTARLLLAVAVGTEVDEEGPGGVAAEGEEEDAPERRAGAEHELANAPADANSDDQDADPERPEHRVVGVEELLHASRYGRARRVDKGRARAGSLGAHPEGGHE